MHIVEHVCGCIGQLMMGSGLADLIGSAFGGVAASWLRGTMDACDALILDGTGLKFGQFEGKASWP